MTEMKPHSETPFGMKIRVTASTQAALFFTRFLAAYAGRGIRIQRAGPGLWSLEAWLPRKKAGPRTIARLQDLGNQLAVFFSDPAPPTIELVEQEQPGRLPKGEKRFFRPFQPTERLAIFPPGTNPADAGKLLVLTLEIGRARGTGIHPATRTCLSLLEELLTQQQQVPPRALDVGTGTGILALAAASLGVTRVFALDIDPHAVAIARRNVRHNNLVGRIKVRCRDIRQEGGRYPLVMANVTHKVLEKRRRHLIHAAAPGGRLLLGGIRNRRTAEILQAYCPPFELQTQLREAWWTAVLLQKGE
jgi:ribosomal protein L11 methyltransferase